MKLRKLAKIIPLCLVASLVACDSKNEIVTKKYNYFEGTEITMSTRDFKKYGKVIDNALKDINLYANQEYLDGVYKSCLSRLVTHVEHNVYYLNLKEHSHLYYMLHAANEAIGVTGWSYSPYLGNYKKVWRSYLDNGEILPYEERPQFEKRRSLFQGQHAMFYEDSFKVKYAEISDFDEMGIDLSDVVESYAFDSLMFSLRYLDIKDYLIRTSEYNMLVGENPATASKDYELSFVGPYGKPLSVKAKNSFVTMANNLGNSTVINGDTYSTKYFSIFNGPLTVNDAVILLADDFEYLNPCVITAAGATSMMFSYGLDEIIDMEQHIHVKAIVFKNGELAYCNEGLEVVYNGVDFGKFGKTNNSSSF